jgi:hypothetical protein
MASPELSPGAATMNKSGDSGPPGPASLGEWAKENMVEDSTGL